MSLTYTESKLMIKGRSGEEGAIKCRFYQGKISRERSWNISFQRAYELSGSTEALYVINKEYIDYFQHAKLP